MKTLIPLLLSFSVLPLFAQPPGDAPARPSKAGGVDAPERRGSGPGFRAPPPGFRGERGPERGSRPHPEGFKPDFERYLNNLKQRNPEEAARLGQLREELGEEAFHAAIREQFRRGRERMGGASGPNGPGSPGGGMGMFRKPNPALGKIRERLRRALGAYHANPGDESKAALRKVIEEEFDEGLADHRRHIEAMESALEKMKSHLAQQREARTTLIEDRLEKAVNLRLPKRGHGREGPPPAPRKKPNN